MNKQEKITPMRLLDLWTKTDHNQLGDMTSGERLLMSTLITYVNGSLTNGYEAYPSGDILVRRTGLSIKTIERFRKQLIDANWIKVVSGKGKGNANHYFLNFRRIVESYNRSNPADLIELPSGADYSALLPAPSKTVRNTSHLKQGNHSAPKKPVQPDYDPYEETEEPF